MTNLELRRSNLTWQWKTSKTTIDHLLHPIVGLQDGDSQLPGLRQSYSRRFSKISTIPSHDCWAFSKVVMSLTGTSKKLQPDKPSAARLRPEAHLTSIIYVYTWWKGVESNYTLYITIQQNLTESDQVS